MVLQVDRVLQERQEQLEAMEQLDLLVPLDRLVPLAAQDHLGRQVPRDLKVQRVNLALKAIRDLKDLLAITVTKDHLVAPVALAQWALQDLPVLTAIQDNLALKVRRVLMDYKDHKV